MTGYDRAAPKGSGSYKIGANYANTFKPYKFAHEQGYAELLYLNSSTREFVDEFGSSNFFGIKGNKYITPLSDSVLPSITNKTLQQVAVDLGMEVEKRPVPLDRRGHHAALAHRHEAGARAAGSLPRVPVLSRRGSGPEVHGALPAHPRHPGWRIPRRARLVPVRGGVDSGSIPE